MKYVILVLMTFLDPAKATWDNSVYITGKGQESLLFTTREECFEYAEENQVELFRFAYNMFEGDAIPAAMTCAPEDPNATPGSNA